MQRQDAILNQIHEIRMLKKRNIHDCADFLNISKEDYLKFEQGSEMLSLPEIELLAKFFGVSPRIFIQANPWKEQKLGILDDHVQPQYKNLRHKLIQAKILGQIDKKSITLDQIHDETGIEVCDLKKYLEEGQPIPFDHLLKISNSASLAIESLIDHTWPENTENNNSDSTADWQQEFPAKEIQEDQQATTFDLLALALHKLPKRDQAEIAKFLLEKLKTFRSV